jgi:hypothetical protein
VTSLSSYTAESVKFELARLKSRKETKESEITRAKSEKSEKLAAIMH